MQPWHVSNTGVVTGQTERDRAATWSQARGLQVLPAVTGFSQSEARGSNASGEVAGFASGDGSAAFVYSNGKVVLLPGVGSRALAINDSGSVVGEAEAGGKPPLTAVLWKDGRLNNLGGCCGGVAKGINRRGQIIADLYDQKGHYRAFLWENARLQTMGSGSGYSSAIAINDAGHVLLQELERGVFVCRGSDATVQIKIPDRLPADGRAINNSDVVVGAFGPFFDADHAFVWSEQYGFRDLNDLIPANSGWTLQVATGINDRGEIVGYGDHNGEDDTGFLLVPYGQ